MIIITVYLVVLGNKKPSQPYGVKPKESANDKELLFHARLLSIVSVLSLIATIVLGVMAL